MRAVIVLLVALLAGGCAVSSPTSPPPSDTPEFVVQPTTPETVTVLSWPMTDPEAFAEAACAGTTWTVRDPYHGACKAQILEAVGAMAASHGLLVICEYSNGRGKVVIGGHLNPPPSFDPLTDAELNCSLGVSPSTDSRVLRFVDLP